MKLLLLCCPLLALPVSAQALSEPPTAPDINPDPDIVEVNLTAAETTWEYVAGVQTTVWAYNGTVPGPTIRAKVGDTVIVNFTNDLPEETTIHWHGLEIPAAMDGSHISQPLIPANGGTFKYQFVVNNDKLAWYHPHVRPFDQVEKGLYGTILIEDPLAEQELGLTNIEETVVVFDDVLLDMNNQVVPAFSFSDPLVNALYHLNGREGNVLLINGRDASTATWSIPNGQPQRWRVLNAANTTFCRLDFRDENEGMDEELWQLGSDSGFSDKPFQLLDVQTVSASPDHPLQAQINNMGEGILLLPGERMDVIFTPRGADGETFKVFQRDWYRGRHVAFYGTDGSIKLGDDPLDGLYAKQQYLEVTLQGPDPGTGEFTPPPVLASLPPVDPDPDNYNKLLMTFGHGDPNPATGAVTLFAQAAFDDQGNITPLPAPKISSANAKKVNVGETWLWEIKNLTHGDHNFHTHGFDFELIEYEFFDGMNPANNATFSPMLRRMKKDVIRVPARLGAKGSSFSVTRLAVTFSDVGREDQAEAGGEVSMLQPDGTYTSGGWLVHCHILEHSAKGMLSFFEVRDPDVRFHMLGYFLPGTNGRMELTATSTFVRGSPMDFYVRNALPNSTVYLVAGNFRANRPFRGGVLVPGHSRNGTTLANEPRFSAIFSATTDGNGDAVISTTAWNQVLSGKTTYWQLVQQDAGAPMGWALSNALSFTKP